MAVRNHDNELLLERQDQDGLPVLPADAGNYGRREGLINTSNGHEASRSAYDRADSQNLLHVQDSADCTQQMQVTAFQSAQKDSSILSPRSSTSLDSPMARALAASAAGDLPLSKSHMCPWHLRALSFSAMITCR